MTVTDSQITADEALAFADAPAQYFDHSWPAMQHVERGRLEALQLKALQARFADLPGRIPTLGAMVGEQGVTAIDAVDDVVPLLFQHSVYKSYPASLLEKGKFTQLTRWLDRLTTHDLSGVDVSGCEGIDEWLDVLDEQTPLMVVHSSGTSGTMSFIPRSKDEVQKHFLAGRAGLFQFTDPDGTQDHSDDYFDLVWPLYHRGRSAIMRVPEVVVPDIVRSEEHVHAMRKGRMSSDAMYLAGKVRAATARGELQSLKISPALLARKEEFEREQLEMQQGLSRFVDETIEKLRGKRIWLVATWGTLDAVATAALERGLHDVFAPDSLVMTGGGAKGAVVRDGWEDRVKEFVGVPAVQHMYAMSELMAMNKLCEHGHYHFEPWVIPFVLDPEDGTPLPRSGTQTGRAAFYDLLASTYWGGFITGDEITADFEPCACGRTTVHVHREVTRFSEKQGGDDKITCAASDAAHAGALEFLNGRLA
jgi:hypothetical protein